jgi:pimeloyl-ACP methyl ester carboxylesterase
MSAARRGMFGLGAAAAATLAQAPAQAQAPAAPAPPPLPYRAHGVRTPDGLTLAAYDYGNPQGQPILFIHGYGWSYGGRVMGDYLTVHGHRGLGAMNWVCAVSSANRAGFGRGGRFGAQVVSAEPATAIRGTVGFLRECFDLQPTTADFETMLAFNMMLPRHARISLLGRPASYDTQLRALDIPVLVTHGAKDKLITAAMARHTTETAAGARLSTYEDYGHSPFWEDAPRFNRELAELARGVRRG